MNRRSSRARGQRRKLVWARTFNSTTVNVAASTAGTVSLTQAFQTALGADIIGCTVMRIIGYISLTNSTNSHAIPFTAGIVVFSAPGIPAAQADPEANAHQDFMWWKRFNLNPVDTNVGNRTAVSDYPVDVRSRRKMSELNQDLVLVYRNSHATDTIALDYSFSTLLALP